MDKTIWILRHGQTDLNAAGIIQGQGVNPPLNKVGIEQSAKFYYAYQNEPFDLVIYSNLLRSKQTIESFLTDGIQGLENILITEISWGKSEGMASSPEILAAYEKVNKSWIEGKLGVRPDGGESALEIGKRCEIFVRQIEKINRKNILICSHGRTIRVLGCILEDKPLTEMHLYDHHNLGLYKYDYTSSNSKWKMVLTNDISHLNH